MAVTRALGLAFLVGTVPLVLVALRHLAARDYVGGGLILFAAAAFGHLGLELVALARAEGTPGSGTPGDAGEEEPP